MQTSKTVFFYSARCFWESSKLLHVSIDLFSLCLIVSIIRINHNFLSIRWKTFRFFISVFGNYEESSYKHKFLCEHEVLVFLEGKYLAGGMLDHMISIQLILSEIAKLFHSDCTILNPQ